jgi:phage-related minor tail protein
LSEVLRDLVVTLSLNSDNFTRNIKSVNRQIQEAQSEFRLATSGMTGFES